MNLPAADAGPTVADVMLRDPEVHPSSATVADVRAAFASPKQKLFVIADGTRYMGALTREHADGATDGAAVTELDVNAVPTLAPDAPSSDVYALVAEHDLNRIPVVDADGVLHGLVCFNRTRETFCVA